MSSDGGFKLVALNLKVDFEHMGIDARSRDAYRVWTRAIIRYSDLDPNGHVNNGAMNAYLEDGRVHFRRTHLASIAADTLAGFVLVRFSVEYHAPLHYPGEVDIGTSVSRIGRTSYTLRQAVFDAERCCASAEVITVCLDPESKTPRPFTQAWRDLFGQFLVEFD